MKGNLKGSWRRAGTAALCLLGAGLSACSAHGGAVPQGGLPPMSTQAQPLMADSLAPLDDANATTGTIVYISDSNGVIWTVNLSTLAIHRVGVEETILTDLGFDPINHVLYGVSFSEFYRVSTSSGLATPIGPLGISDANALVFDANGKGYAKGYKDTELYAINRVSTGATSVIGSTGSWKCAGDLTFYNNTLVLSGFPSSGNVYTSQDALVTLNPSTGAVVHVAQTSLVQLYGLFSPSANHLYGFAKTSLYELFPGATTIAGRSKLLKNFATSGVGNIYGAAFNGNFQI
jgi:hypothetical protein